MARKSAATRYILNVLRFFNVSSFMYARVNSNPFLSPMPARRESTRRAGYRRFTINGPRVVFFSPPEPSPPRRSYPLARPPTLRLPISTKMSRASTPNCSAALSA